MTPMTPEEVKAAVIEGVKDAIGDLFIDRKQHYEDHVFVKGVRGGIKTARKGSLYTLGAAIAGAIIYAIQTWITSNTPAP